MVLHRWIVVAAGLALVGCTKQPAPPRVPVPQSPRDGSVKTYEPLRPLEGQAVKETIPPPLFDDVPLVTQSAPEEPAYVEAYAKVGRPRMTVLVNSMLSSATADNSSPDALVKSLAAGEYDEAQAKQIDFETIELEITQTLAANGKVTLVSPAMARQHLTDQEVKTLQAGEPQKLRELAEKLDADVLIQVQTRPITQTNNGLGIRVIADAFNTRGGESVSRSYVEIAPPLDKPTMDRQMRLLARKVMHNLTGSWNAMSELPALPNESRTVQPQPLSPTTMPQ